MYPLDFEIWSDVRRFSPVWDQIELINPLCVFMSAVEAEQYIYLIYSTLHKYTSLLLSKEVSSVKHFIIHSCTINCCILISTKKYKEKYGWKEKHACPVIVLKPVAHIVQRIFDTSMYNALLWCHRRSEPVAHIRPLEETSITCGAGISSISPWACPEHQMDYGWDGIWKNTCKTFYKTARNLQITKLCIYLEKNFSS